MPSRPNAVAFDIIGTVFTMEPMRPKLMALGLPPLALDYLYALGLRDMFALAASNRFAPFVEVLGGCLDEVLALHRLSASAAQIQDVLTTMTALPPHADAGDAFRTLSKAGLRIFALSNGAAAATRGLLEAAGLADLVEGVLSVEEVRLSKPRPEVYLYAARTAGLAPERMALVATHPWDVHGAKVAGLLGAYVARGLPYSPALTPPDLTGESLLDVARQIAALR